MNEARVRLMTLYEKTSASGNRYFTGRLGLARVVVFRDDRAEIAEGGDPQWTVFLSEAPDQPARTATAAPQGRPGDSIEAPARTGQPGLANSRQRPSGRHNAPNASFQRPTGRVAQGPDDPLDDVLPRGR